MKRYLSASLKIGERRHPAGHANVWFGLAALWLIPRVHGQASQPGTPASQILWYPIIKELCEFWEDSLKEGPGGKLISPESVSPEHGPKAQGNCARQW